ncbi:MAG: copper transporter [Actinomycetes bacterium]
MIDFRYYLVSIVAIFFALAIGIVLGSGPLEGDINSVVQGTNDQLAAEKKALQEEVVGLQDGLVASQDYAAGVQSLVVDGQLNGQTAAVIVLPGASDGQVTDAVTAIEQSGARVGSTVRLTDAWSDPDQQDVLRRVADALDKTPTSSVASEAAGGALAAALVTSSPTTIAPGAGVRVDPQGVAVVSGLVEAGFLKVDDSKDLRKASVALVVAPDDDPDQAKTQTYVPLIDALDADGRGVVVGGGPKATLPGGTIEVVRNSASADAVSTVDDLDLSMGPGTALLALVQQLDGGVGQYGMHEGADAVVPEQTPASP